MHLGNFEPQSQAEILIFVVSGCANARKKTLRQPVLA
jgi:hypothetical protein